MTVYGRETLLNDGSKSRRASPSKVADFAQN